MIKTYTNTLNFDLIKDINDYLNTILQKSVWSSNNSWNKNLLSSSSNILCHLIQNKNINKKIKICVEDKINLKFEQTNLKFICHIYIWGAGSYIPWHDDSCYPYNGTIYLNEEWDSDNGGIFLYKNDEKNKIFGIEPQYNLMVVNYENQINKQNSHCVTYILPTCIERRITIQWRAIKFNKNNKIIYL